MKRSAKKRAARWAAAVFLLTLCAAGAGLHLRHALFQTRHAGFAQAVFVEVPRGMPTSAIGGRLAEAGVLRAGWQLMAMRLLRPMAKLQAGDYRFAAPATAAEVFDRLARGDIFTYELRVPEGSNVFDIARLVEEQGIATAAEMLRAVKDVSLIADLAPLAPSLEGYLFPATYHFRRRTTAADVCRTMTQQFRRVWRSLGLRADVHKTVTLASLVEKETASGNERAKIAGVFTNRLAKRMSLDCDPTVVYAALVEGRWDGIIHKSDLASANAYNTYKHPGLPPGPIANPGLASLQAALEPDTTDALFFVARPDGSGTHVFSTGIDDHQKAVGQYRRGQAKATAGVDRGARAGKAN